jgi:hypothetical protein
VESEPDYDIEESPEVLEEDDPIDWVGAHKRVVFQAIDYHLGSLADQAVSGDLDLQPQYQRRLRWSPDRKSRLIESCLMNVPIPPIFLSEEKDGTYAVIDGKQRITAITDFLRHGMPLTGLKFYSHLNGKTVEELPEADRKFVSNRIALRAIIVLEQSPPEIRLETFQRLNTGGIQLNAQEIRNIAFRGPLNDLIMELSEVPKFHDLLKIKDPKTSAIHQQMRDAELVLRFLAFRTSWKSFDGSIKRHMDTFMAQNQAMNEADLTTIRTEFHRVLDVVEAGFGEHAFARFQATRGQWRRQVVAAVYDAEMLAAQNFDLADVKPRRDDIIEATRKMFGTKRFQESTEAATNATKAFEYRIGAMDRLLRRATK